MAFILEYASSLLTHVFNFLGLANKTGTVIFLGLDNAGKTTLLYHIAEDCVRTHSPTLYPTHKTVTIGKLTMRVHDLGGHELARRVWADYYSSANAIIYLVDSTDSERWPESRKELDNLLGLFQDEEMKTVPVALLVSKTDDENSAAFHEVIHALQVEGMMSNNKEGGRRPFRAWPISVRQHPNRANITEAANWLGEFF